MEVCALSSGSSGNCFLVSSGNGSVLVDCGISCKRIEERMQSIKKDVEDIKGIFVTHEHSDHTRGIDVFSRKFKVPIFATKKLIEEKFLCSNQDLINSIGADETNSLVGLDIVSFQKVHKAIEPISFTIIDKHSGKNISIITDAGHACKNISDNISSSNCLLLESNHDLEMLENGPYPYFLKNWIRSDNGHLSNEQASETIFENAKPKLKNILLCHLSEHNNTPELAMSTHKKFLKRRIDLKPQLYISTKLSASPLIKVI